MAAMFRRRSLAFLLSLSFLCACSAPQSRDEIARAEATAASRIFADTFVKRSGMSEHQWMGGAITQVFLQAWTRDGVYVDHPVRGAYVLEGDYWVKDGRLTVSARLTKGIRTVETWQWTGGTEMNELMPFWDKMLADVNQTLIARGLAVTMPRRGRSGGA
jgi:TolB-like protein